MKRLVVVVAVVVVVVVIVFDPIFSRDVFVNKPLVRVGMASTSKRRPKNAALSGEKPIHHHATQPVKLVEGSPMFPSANRAQQNCKQKHRLGTLLHSSRMETKRIRIQVCRNVENV